VEGYDHPKRGDKPLFSNQLGTYADKLRSLYPATTDKTTNQTKKWNKSPLHKNRNNINRTLIFDTDEYPALSTSKPNPKRTQQGDLKPLSTSPKSASTVAITAQEIRDQIIKDMTNDVTKLINTEIKNLRNELTSNLTSLKTDLQQDLNSQITEVLKTIQTLNQRFNEVMERLPSSPTQTPAHKKPKGLGVSNYMHIRISTDLEAPWDNSDDSFFTPPRDDDSASISSTSSFLSSNDPPQPVQQIQNPYHHERQPPWPNIIQTLRSWLQPQPTPVHPILPHHPTISTNCYMGNMHDNQDTHNNIGRAATPYSSQTADTTDMDRASTAIST